MSATEGVRVQRVRPEQLRAAGEVTVAAYGDFVAGPEDPYLKSLRDVATRDREAEVYVATWGDRVIGCVTWCPPGSPWRELAAEDDGEFRMLAVDPAQRGRGAGAALVGHCEQLAEIAGAGRMVLSSLPQMQAAHRLYARMGYRREPDRDWEPRPGLSLIAFAKELAP